MTTLRERIAALEKRNAASSPSVPATTPSPSSTPANSSAGRLKSVRDVASRFDEIGGAPVPRGSFGLGAPQSSGPKSTTSRELYGNRIPKPRNVSAGGSPNRSTDGLPRTSSGPHGTGEEGSQAGSEMGDEDWEERVSDRSASPIGDHPDHQQHASHSGSDSPSPNTPDVHNEDEPAHHSPAAEPPTIAVSSEQGLALSTGESAAAPAAAVNQPLPPSPGVEPDTLDETVVAESTTAAEIPAPREPSPIPQEPIAQPEVKPTEDIETQPTGEDTPRAATFAVTDSATDAEPSAAIVPADSIPAYVEPQVESTNADLPQPAVVEEPAPAPVEPTPIPVAQNDIPAPVEEQTTPLPAPEPTADQDTLPPIVDETKPIAASPVKDSEAPPHDPSPAAEEPIASQPAYEAVRRGSLAAVPEDEPAPAPAPAPAPVGRKRGLSVHVPEPKPNNTTIVDEANDTEIRPLPPLPQIPAGRTSRSPSGQNYRSTSMYIPSSPVSPTMTEFAMGQGGVNPPLRGSSLRRNVESTQSRIERRIAVSTSGSGGGGTGFGRSGSSGWRSLPTASDVTPLPVVSVLPSKMRDRRDSQDKSRPKSMADIFQSGEWAHVPDLSLEIPKTPTRLPANKLLPNPISPDSNARPLSSSTLASFMDTKGGTVNSTIFDEFPEVPNHIPPSQIFTETEDRAPTPTPESVIASPPLSTLSPPHHEDDRVSAASVKSKGSKFRGLSKLMGSAAHSITHGVQRTVSQRRRTSDASEPGSSPSRTFSDLKKHSAVGEPESPLRSSWMEEEKKKKTGWASIGVGRRK